MKEIWMFHFFNQNIWPIAMNPSDAEHTLWTCSRWWRLDKAPRLSIRIVIWILPSDICQLNKNISKYWDGNAIYEAVQWESWPNFSTSRIIIVSPSPGREGWKLSLQRYWSPSRQKKSRQNEIFFFFFPPHLTSIIYNI